MSQHPITEHELPLEPIARSKRTGLVVSALGELDFDLKVGKIIEEDYLPLRTQLMAKPAEYIQVEEKEPERLQALIRMRRAAQQPVSKCGCL
jgi:uncharacterized protein (DUF2249 family)